MWRLYEPIHSVVYFHPNATASYSKVGLKGGWMSYFASRSAALGTPSAEVVEALFYHFAPAMVKRAIPDAWGLASPHEILRVRLEIAIDAIQNGIEGLVSKTELDLMASRLYDIAVSLPISGRALYAAHLTVDWGDSPAARLFGAATLLREHRGDTHNAALATHGIDGVFIDLSVLREFREIVNESKMDGAIRFLRAFAQAVEIFKGTAMDFSAQCLKRLCIIVGAGKAEHLVPVRDQFPGCGGADKAGRAGDEYAHEDTPVKTGEILLCHLSG